MIRWVNRHVPASLIVYDLEKISYGHRTIGRSILVIEDAHVFHQLCAAQREVALLDTLSFDVIH